MIKRRTRLREHIEQKASCFEEDVFMIDEQLSEQRKILAEQLVTRPSAHHQQPPINDSSTFDFSPSTSHIV